MATIEFHGVTKVYDNGVVALDRVSLRIESGEWIAIMGPSGAGKSTLLHLIAALDRPTAGSIRVDGRAIHDLSASAAAEYRRQYVGMIFQQFHLVPYLTALENVMIAQYFHSVPDADEARSLLEAFGLGDRLHHYPHQLSGGEQQRVAIARALVNDPPIILADEPTGNLDEASERTVLDLLRSIHARGKTVVLVTHAPHVARLSQRQIYMEHGRLVERHLERLHAHPVEDEVLETLWKCEEQGRATTQDVLLRAEMLTEEAVRAAEARGLVEREPQGNGLRLTAVGRERARLLVRRHRLAEYLLQDVVGLSPRFAQDTACQFEHILSAEATDAICTFLQHPRTCPHGRPIPPGNCCTATGAARGAS